MKRNSFLQILFLLLAIGLRAQITTSEVKVEETDGITTIQHLKLLKVPNSSAGEGGEFILSGDGYNDWIVDNYKGNYRLHHSGFSYINVSPNGNLGIGTTPRAKFDLGTSPNNTLSAVLARLPEGNSTDNGTYLGVRSFGTQPVWTNSFSIEHSFYGKINSSINFHRGNGFWNGFITMNTDNNTERLRIDHNGNVGIGTTSPTARLHVNGDIRTAQNHWSDHVFKKDYNLPTLSQVEKQIKEQGHLSEIPSEKEVLENGYLLGDMDAKLLQKIEELTLYLIMQSKEIKALKTKNLELERRLETVEE